MHMANPIYEFDPVTQITADALGSPGHRTFYIQAERGPDRITLTCEKEQIQALAEAIDEMLESLEKEHNREREKDPVIDEARMIIREPVEPLFRVGSMGLGYDENRDRILLVVQELLPEEEKRDPLEVRLFATRAQMQAVSIYARSIIARGRSPEQRALQVEAYVRRNGHGE
jgi:uncharacterized repeat protein (TIGR03847 family)